MVENLRIKSHQTLQEKRASFTVDREREYIFEITVYCLNFTHKKAKFKSKKQLLKFTNDFVFSLIAQIENFERSEESTGEANIFIFSQRGQNWSILLPKHVNKKFSIFPATFFS